MRCYIAVCFYMLSQHCFSQWQNNNWYFGYHSSITFNSGSPQNTGPLNFEAGEHSSGISDSNGAVLFFTDGYNVFDRLEQPMSNGAGLLTTSTSTQGSLILKKPGFEHLYYLFTVAAESDTGGFVYSEVDMLLNGGFGDLTANKNIPLLANTTEKLTGVRHSNGMDYWVIVHEYGNDAFYFYLVDSNGVGGMINVSNAGSPVVGTEEMKRGYMRVSLDGSILAMTDMITGQLQIFQINDQLGILTDVIILNGFTGSYGLEFSPGGNKLYMTRRNETSAPPVNELYQFDLSNWDHDSIMNSAQIIDTLSGFSTSALALGPDGVVYVAQNIKGYIGAILEPDLEGQTCQFLDSALALTPPGFCKIGLPNFIKEPLDPSLNIGQIPVQEEILKAWWVDGSLNFELLQMPEKNWELSIHDLAGRKVAELEGRSEKAWQIPTTEWNTAVYVWRWNNGNESRFGKVYVH